MESEGPSVSDPLPLASLYLQKVLQPSLTASGDLGTLCSHSLQGISHSDNSDVFTDGSRVSGMVQWVKVPAKSVWQSEFDSRDRLTDTKVEGGTSSTELSSDSHVQVLTRVIEIIVVSCEAI